MNLLGSILLASVVGVFFAFMFYAAGLGGVSAVAGVTIGGLLGFIVYEGE